MLNPSRTRILRLKSVVDIISLSRSTVYRLINDGVFPKPFKLGASSIGWDSADIDQWIAERKLATYTIH